MVEQAKNGIQYWNFQNSIFRKFFEQNHFNAFDLSQRYQEEQRLREAESLIQKEVETMGSVFGNGHLLVQDLRTQLSSLMVCEGRWNDAEKLQIRQIELDATENEGQDADALVSDLAITYKNQGRWEEAEELQMWTIETSTREFGPKPPPTLH